MVKQHITKLFFDPSNHIFIQFVRYGLVVCVAFPIDFGLLYIFTSKLGMYYLLSATLSFAISMVVNFTLSIAWVFSSRTKKALWKEFSAFCVIGFVGLALTDLIVWLCTDRLDFHYLFSKLVAVSIVFFWSFFARRYLFQYQRQNHDSISKA